MLKEHCRRSRPPAVRGAAAGRRFTNCRRTAGRNRMLTPTKSRKRSSASSARRSAAGRSVRRPRTSAAFCAPIWMRMIRPSPASYDAAGAEAYRHRGGDRLSARPRSVRRAPRLTIAPRSSPARRCIRSSKSSIPVMRISARSTGSRYSPTISRMAGWSTGRRCRTGRSLDLGQTSDHGNRGWRALCRQRRRRRPRSDRGARRLCQSDERPGRGEGRHLCHDRVVDRHGVHQARHTDRRRFRPARPRRGRIPRRRVTLGPSRRSRYVAGLRPDLPQASARTRLSRV